MSTSLIDAPTLNTSDSNPSQRYVDNLNDANYLQDVSAMDPALMAAMKGREKEIPGILSKVRQAGADGVITQEEVREIAGGDPVIMRFLEDLKIAEQGTGQHKGDKKKKRDEEERNQEQEVRTIVAKEQASGLGTPGILALGAALGTSDIVSRQERAQEPPISSMSQMMDKLGNKDQNVLKDLGAHMHDIGVSGAAPVSNSRPSLAEQTSAVHEHKHDVKQGITKDEMAAFTARLPGNSNN
jgi:hypothetical protein